jgi:calcium/calmodulin-dependent protein kinase (CaM kinase) II
MDAAEKDLLELTAALLRAIAAGDWEGYVKLCDPDLTCFEPEASGQLVTGLDFHRYYFDLEKNSSPRNTTLASPSARIIGPVGVVCYVRLTQSLNGSGVPVTRAAEETRVWRNTDAGWKLIHIHRSAPTTE